MATLRPDFEVGEKVILSFGVRQLPGIHIVTAVRPGQVTLDGVTTLNLYAETLFHIEKIVQTGASTSEEMQAILNHVPETLARLRQDEAAFRERVIAQQEEEVLPDEMTVEEMNERGGWAAFEAAYGASVKRAKARNA